MKNIIVVFIFFLMMSCGGAVDGLIVADRVMVGDGTTAGGDWFNILDNHADNLGAVGDTTIDIANRLPSIISNSPARVYLMAGINDFIVLGDDAPTTLDRYLSIVDDLQASGIEVYVQSTLFVSRDIQLRGVNPAAMNLLIKDFNTMLAAACKQRGVVFLDINAALAAGGYLEEGYARSNGYHVNSGAYLTWAGIINRAG